MKTIINHYSGRRIRLELSIGDITSQKTMAIVNAANESLAAGGGVCGAIARSGGMEIFDDCKKWNPVLATGRQYFDGNLRCPVGSSRVSDGGKLPASFVVHAVGPRYDSKNVALSELQLINAYSSALNVAVANNCTSISFPSLSTGIFGFPLKRAAELSMLLVCEFLATQEHEIKSVEFVLFDWENYETFRDELYALRKEVTHRRKAGWLKKEDYVKPASQTPYVLPTRVIDGIKNSMPAPAHLQTVEPARAPEPAPSVPPRGTPALSTLQLVLNRLESDVKAAGLAAPDAKISIPTTLPVVEVLVEQESHKQKNEHPRYAPVPSGNDLESAFRARRKFWDD